MCQLPPVSWPRGQRLGQGSEGSPFSPGGEDPEEEGKEGEPFSVLAPSARVMETEQQRGAECSLEVPGDEGKGHPAGR